MTEQELDGNRSINAAAREQMAPVLGLEPPRTDEFFREYRAFGAEEEPWREEVCARPPFRSRTSRTRPPSVPVLAGHAASRAPALTGHAASRAPVLT